MLVALALASLIAASPGNGTGTVHNGRAGELDVRPPRIEAEVAIDGRLDEAPWLEAAYLTGFSRYAPTDGVAADDSTVVLVWYSPTAIHFGIRAYAQPGTVHATLADRDKIYNDDYIGVFLATFNDGRQATVFAVNPLGVQGDGIVVERGASSGGGFSGIQTGREPTDIAPDYVFQSKGRVTDYGYEIEIRIPFKSLRYQSSESQTWGINILRKVQSRGHEDSWAPAQRAAASYIAQFGRLDGLTGLQRGLVLDVNPVVTSRTSGVRDLTGSGYPYTTRPDVGGNVRWGITNTHTLNATINPDFAEVESDAGQIVFDPRRALFFSEKRPFFLEGIEQFSVPNQLVYTRRIANPVAAAKLTGKNGGTSVAFLSAVDGRDVSFANREHPLYNILRVQQDLGPASRVGLLYTDRMDGDHSNRVLGADARIVWRKIYSAQLQAAGSVTTAPEQETLRGSVLMADMRRSGRTFNARYRFNMIHDQFRAHSGFIGRPSNAHLLLSNSYTLYGGEGALIQSAAFNVVADGLWQYERFVNGGDMIEKKLHLNNNFVLKGGWEAGASVLVETFGFDDDLYSNVFVVHPNGAGADTVPFTGRPRLGNLDYVLSVTTPNFKRFSASASYVWGRDENFYEWTSANIAWIAWDISWRPSDQFRATASYDEQYYRRLSDNSLVAQTRIPRLRVEYQLTRSIFVRALAEYRADFADDLRESDRSNNPLIRRTLSGFAPARGFTTALNRPKEINELRPELLFSYLPSPGTVIYAGYGGTLNEAEAFRFGRGGGDGFERQNDSFFVKLSYLFRL